MLFLSGKTLLFRPLYGISKDKNEELRKYLKKNLDKGFIRASQSPAASLVIFMKKLGGGLRFYVDYRIFNNILVKNKYLLPLILETLNKLSKVVIFIKLDIILAFNKIRIKEGQEWMIAFKIKYRLFKLLILLFRLCNRPFIF